MLWPINVQTVLFFGDKARLFCHLDVFSVCRNCAAQVADIIDTMGIASAKAQDLQHAITSADKLRISDHLVYLMIDSSDNK